MLNKCYGGFGISVKAAEFMAARGNQTAINELAEYEKRRRKHWYGYHYKRDDPDLIAAVEELGSAAASGDTAKLEIDYIYIPEIEDMIKDHDGFEWVD